MATTAVTSDDSLFNILEFSSSDTSTSNVDMSVNVSTLSDGRVPGSPPRDRDRELSTIAFTPGRTTLNKESMLMLQKKFGTKSEPIRHDDTENVPLSQDTTVSAALSKVSGVRTPHKSSIPVASHTPRNTATGSQLKGLRPNDSARNAQSVPANDIDPSPTAASKSKRLKTPSKDSSALATAAKLSRIPVSMSKKKRSDRSGSVSFAAKQDVIVVDTNQPPEVATLSPSSPKNGKRVSLAGTTPFKNSNFQILEDDNENQGTPSQLSEPSPSTKSSCSRQTHSDSPSKLMVKISPPVKASPRIQATHLDTEVLPPPQQVTLHQEMKVTREVHTSDELSSILLESSPTTELNRFLAKLENGGSSVFSRSCTVVPVVNLEVAPASPQNTVTAMLTGHNTPAETNDVSSPDSVIERLTRSSTRKESPTYDSRGTERKTTTKGTRVSNGSPDITPLKFDNVSPPASYRKSIPMSTPSVVQSHPDSGAIGESSCRRRSDDSPAPQPSGTSPPRVSPASSLNPYQQHDDPQLQNDSGVSGNDRGVMNRRIGSPGMQKCPGRANALGLRHSKAESSIHEGKITNFTVDRDVYRMYDFENEEEQSVEGGDQLHSSPHRSGLGSEIKGNQDYVSKGMPKGVELSEPNFEGVSLHCPGLRRRDIQQQPSIEYPVEAVPFLMSENVVPEQQQRTSQLETESRSKYNIVDNIDEVLATTINAVNESFRSNDVVYRDSDDDESDGDSSSQCRSVDMALSDLLGTPQVSASTKKTIVKDTAGKHQMSDLYVPQSLEALRVPCSLRDDSLLSARTDDGKTGHSFNVENDMQQQLNDSIEEEHVGTKRKNDNSDYWEDEHEYAKDSFREEFSDISLDCSAITFDPPAPPAPFSFCASEDKNKTRKPSNKAGKQKLVHMSKAKQTKKATSNSCTTADIKEVTMQGFVNKATSASLTFENKKKSPMKLSAAVILVRVDEIECKFYDQSSSPKRIKSRSDNDETTNSPLKSEMDNAFSLSPISNMLIEPGKEIKLKITFKPCRVAYYSGVIKIKCGSKSYVVLLRGEAMDPPNKTILGHASNLLEHTSNETALTPPGYRHEKEQGNSDERLHESGDWSTKYMTGFGDEDDYADDSVFMQQKWVKHWISKELTRSVSRSEVRYSSNPSTGEKKYISKYEEWVQSPHADVVPSGVAISSPIHMEHRDDERENIGELSIFPKTVFVDKHSGEAVSSSVNACNGGIVTIQNKSSRSRMICAEASASVMLTSHGSGSDSQVIGMQGRKSTFEIQPFSFVRLALKICPDYISTMSKEYKHDMGEIHWGYIVISCEGTKQETVCDIRSSDTISRGYGVEKEKAYTPPAHAINNLNTEIEIKTEGKDDSHLMNTPLAKTRPVKPQAVYFSKQCLDFGTVAVGSLKRMKATLCNASDKELLLFVADPELPFLVSHNEVRMQPRSYIRLPVRMVPITGNRRFSGKVTVKSADGQYDFSLNLMGNTL